jgi:hypothetical protein
MFEGDRSKPLVLLLEYEGPPSRTEPFGVPIENNVTNILHTNRNAVFGRVQHCTDRQAYEIIWVCHSVRFIEVVDTPDKTSERVSPSSETGDMKISHRQEGDCVRQIRTDAGPQPGPSIERTSQEPNWILRHFLMLDAKLVSNNRGLVADPGLKFFGCLYDVHWYLSSLQVKVGSTVATT